MEGNIEQNFLDFFFVFNDMKEEYSESIKKLLRSICTSPTETFNFLTNIVGAIVNCEE
jgi:hypothetical protein